MDRTHGPRAPHVGIDADGAKADGTLRASADVVRLLPIGVMTFRYEEPETLTLLDVNPAALAMVGGRVENWVGKQFDELWPAAMTAKVKPGVLAAARGDDPYQGEVALRRNTELRHAFRVRGFAIPDGRVVMAFEEITEQRRAEESLLQSEAEYRSLLEDLSDVVFAADADGVVTYISPAVTSLLGYRPEDVMGRPYTEFGPPGELPTLADLAATFAAAPAAAPLEYRLLTRSGEVRWVRTSGTLQYGDDGAVVGLHGVFGDITETRRTAEALEKAHRDMELVLNATHDYVTYYSPDMVVQWVNRAAGHAIGKSRADIVGRPCRSVWRCQSQGADDCAVKRVLETGAPCETRMKTPEGKTFIVRAYPAFVDGKLAGAVEATVDITASQRAKEERGVLEAQLRQSQKLEAIGTLASGIAHEVNNPLMGIINYAELIADRVQDDRLREFADGIKEEGARVAGIVRNLLSFARQDHEEFVLTRPENLVDTALSLVRALLEREGIDVRVDVPADLPALSCRPQQVEQVLLNLLMNARDTLNERFPGTGSQEKHMTVRARVVRADGSEIMRLTVEDNGLGIPEAIRDRVFDPFFTTKPRDRGTGLGLSISYGIVRDHGGRLRIEGLSPPRGATAVHVEVPVRRGLPGEGDASCAKSSRRPSASP